MSEVTIKSEICDGRDWQQVPHSIGGETITSTPTMYTGPDGDDVPVTFKLEVLDEEPPTSEASPLAVEGIFGLENFGKTAKRAPNFTSGETELLLQLIDSTRGVLECKRTDQLTVQKKNQAWKTITTEFNAQTDQIVAFRSENILRKKFENLKKGLKKRATDETNFNLTNGAPTGKRMLTETHEKLQYILHDTQFNSMDSSVLDSDCCMGTSNVNEEFVSDDPLRVSTDDDNQAELSTNLTENKQQSPSAAQESFVLDSENGESGQKLYRCWPKKQKNGKLRKTFSDAKVSWARQAYNKAKWTELKARAEIRIMEKEHEERMKFMQEKHEIEMKILHQQLKSLQN